MRLWTGDLQIQALQSCDVVRQLSCSVSYLCGVTYRLLAGRHRPDEAVEGAM